MRLISLAQWCMSVGSGRRHQRGIAKLYAFLGRYMHQSVAEMERRTVRELQVFAEATRQILDEEKAQFDTLNQSPD